VPPPEKQREAVRKYGPGTPLSAQTIATRKELQR
jgi:hypothetical protein